MNFCNNCYTFIINKKERLTKTITWRLISSATTFIVGYLVQKDIKKAASITIIDTSVKTIFYYFHEGVYENMKAHKRCIYSHNIIDDDNMNDINNNNMNDTKYINDMNNNNMNIIENGETKNSIKNKQNKELSRCNNINLYFGS